MSGGGKGGGNAGPTDNAIRSSMIYPSLRDPVHSAIQDARRLYEQGYQIPGLNRRQQEGVESTEDWASKFQGAIDEPLEYATWLSQGKNVGDAPGQEFLQGVYRNGAGSAGYGTQENILKGLMGSGGAGYGEQQNILQGMMGSNGAGYGTMQGINQQAGAAPGTLDYMRQTAGGGNLQGNPQLDAVIGDMNRGTTQAYQDAMGSLEGGMSRAGAGVGSSVEGQLKDRQNQTLARELAGNEARVRYGDYGQERGYQQQAGMALPGAFNTAINTQMGAAGQLGDMQQSWLQQQQGAAGQLNQMEANRIGMQQGAAGQLSDMQNRKLQTEMEAANAAAGGYRADIGQAMQAGQMMPALGAAGFDPGQQLLQTGDYTRNLLERQQNQGWESFDRYMQGLGGVRNLFGGGNPVPQGQSQAQQGFGNAMQLGQLGLGAAKVFGFSDRRLKTDIEPIGGDLYRWRYVWGGPLYEGPMAQDVQAVAPHLVRTIAGYLAIPSWMIRRC